MKKRSLEQIQASKAVYRKHAERHKVNDYPLHRILRMMAYTAQLSKAIAVAWKR